MPSVLNPERERFDPEALCACGARLANLTLDLLALTKAMTKQAFKVTREGYTSYLDPVLDLNVVYGEPFGPRLELKTMDDLRTAIDEEASREDSEPSKGWRDAGSTTARGADCVWREIPRQGGPILGQCAGQDPNARSLQHRRGC